MNQFSNFFNPSKYLLYGKALKQGFVNIERVTCVNHEGNDPNRSITIAGLIIC